VCALVITLSERRVFVHFRVDPTGNLIFIDFIIFFNPARCEKGGGASLQREALLSYRTSSSFVALSCIAPFFWFSQPLQNLIELGELLPLILLLTFLLTTAATTKPYLKFIVLFS
jgi:hypothetical protein